LRFPAEKWISKNLYKSQITGKIFSSRFSIPRGKIKRPGRISPGPKIISRTTARAGQKPLLFARNNFAAILPENTGREKGISAGGPLYGQQPWPEILPIARQIQGQFSGTKVYLFLTFLMTN